MNCSGRSADWLAPALPLAGIDDRHLSRGESPSQFSSAVFAFFACQFWWDFRARGRRRCSQRDEGTLASAWLVGAKHSAGVQRTILPDCDYFLCAEVG